MKYGKKICGVILVGILMSMAGCGVMKAKTNIVNKKPLKQGLEMKLSGHKGTMKYELEDAYVTTELNKNEIDMSKLDLYSSIEYKNDKGKQVSVSYPEYFADKEKGILSSHAKMYVCRIKVTNEGATSEWEDQYKSPYIFRADNIFLCYLPDEMTRKEQQNIKYKIVDYYSLRKEGDQEWSTYELKPGESITYDLGFVLGDMLDGQELDMKKGKLYLGDTNGSEDGKYYNIDWSEK